jgi:hypothetical protein
MLSLLALGLRICCAGVFGYRGRRSVLPCGDGLLFVYGCEACGWYSIFDHARDITSLPSVSLWLCFCAPGRLALPNTGNIECSTSSTSNPHLTRRFSEPLRLSRPRRRRTGQMGAGAFRASTLLPASAVVAVFPPRSAWCASGVWRKRVRAGGPPPCSRCASCGRLSRPRDCSR